MEKRCDGCKFREGRFCKWGPPTVGEGMRGGRFPQVRVDDWCWRFEGVLVEKKVVEEKAKDVETVEESAVEPSSPPIEMSVVLQGSESPAEAGGGMRISKRRGRPRKVMDTEGADGD